MISVAGRVFTSADNTVCRVVEFMYNGVRSWNKLSANDRLSLQALDEAYEKLSTWFDLETLWAGLIDIQTFII